MSDGPEVLTIGHSTHSLGDFVHLLKQHRVTALADVRSAAFSRHNPQFNRESLEKALKQHGIAYSFLGSELGGRPEDASCYDKQGRVRYEVVEKTAQFRRGVERVMKGAARYRIAVMCAERDPIQCHRTLLVAPGLVEQGANVQHILSDGILEPHERSLDRLAEASGMPRSGIFGAGRQREELRARAGRRMAFADRARGASGVRG